MVLGCPAPGVLMRRIERGVRLYLEGAAPLLLLSGGGAGPVPEADIMQHIALARGVPERALLVERRARNTVENAREAARLLLPRGMAAEFDRSELRYIFLHELAHVRRGDLWINCIVTLLQILHWFNPLIWLGFARMRSDRELACDEMALQHTGEMEAEAYGMTIIKLLKGIQRPAAMPGLVGILEDRTQMRRRILRIA